ncbi:MAG: tetratricopeptide repeat protein [Beijerinckiaceae bacterium]|nr:tetratricopeptide repeat protein [Beijerinckiaceae bacterium]
MPQESISRTFRSKAAEGDTRAQISALLREAASETAAANYYKAAALYLRVVDLDPKQPDALTGIATSMRRQGNLAGATDAYRKALAVHPEIAGNHFGLAEVLRRRGRFDEALEACGKGFAIGAAAGEGLIVRSEIWKDLGQGENAIGDIRRAATQNPKLAPIQILLSDTLCRFGHIDDAITALQNATRETPDDPPLLRELYKLLIAKGRQQEALTVWEKIAEVRSDDAEAYRSLAALYQEQGRTQDAFAAYQKALEIEPKFIRAYMNLAGLMNADNRFDLATAIYRFIVALSPDDAIAHHNLARSLRIEGKWEEAVQENRRALELDPDFVQSHVEFCLIKQYTCDWEGQKASLRILDSFTGRPDSPVPPFTLVIAPNSTRESQLAAALIWAKYKRDRIFIREPFPAKPIKENPGRIRIGYVSSDFHDHATAILMVELLEKHHKDRFEIFAYSFGPEDGSELRKRVIEACDTFRELRAISNSEAARRIYADEIDILIDLKGYTQDCRTEIFAVRPAPIQVNFLGYPGTMGADYIDYIIADPIVIPESHAGSYSERLALLPHCYQPNDRKRAIAPLSASRASYNLPEDGFVFCCFNNPYKIPDFVFNLWMDLLRELPGSVLWLFATNEIATTNLRHHAAARGIDPNRLVFAPRRPNSEHLARLKLADLFLDTLPYNAHTTASDALWAELPVLTCLGDTFAGRVAASLLTAVGLPELITDSLEAYKTKALALAQDPSELRRIRRKLAANRLVTPLFDSDRYVRNFEAALTRMFEQRQSGLAPEAFTVADQC